MNLSTVGGYLGGHARSIRTVAESKAAPLVAMVLVLFTGIGRNYDQLYWRESAFWLVGPLLFSLFSGSFLYGVVFRTFIRSHLSTEAKGCSTNQWLSFMGLFWMTAPIAWIYAIPVERFLSPSSAAQANLTLLAIVSLWRVLLMARVVSVVNVVPFLRSLAWVLVGAALEVILVVFFGQLLSPQFSKRILAGMSGMRNSPEENLLIAALGNAWAGAWIVLVVVLIALATDRFHRETQPYPPTVSKRIPWLGLLLLGVAWTLVALPAQREQHRHHAHATLIRNRQYPEAIAFLARHQPDDFPASRRLEPNPFEYRVWEGLPPTIAQLSAQTPRWIRRIYLGHLSATLTHHRLSFRSSRDIADMVVALEKFPEGREWILTHQARIGPNLFPRNDDSVEARTNRLEAMAALRRLGVAESNLTELVPP